MKETISKLTLYWLMLGMLLFGCCNTVAVKWADEEGFSHAFFQCMIMFIGEFACLFYFFISWHKKPVSERQEIVDEAAREGKNVQFNPHIFGITGALDICTTTLMYAALILVDASIYQMMRGGIPVVTAIFGRIFLKNKIYKHHVLGLSTIFIGIVLVGCASIFFSSEDATIDMKALIGIILLMISFITCSVQFILEEKFLTDNMVDPIQVVGLEGIHGLGMYIVILIVLNQIPEGGGYVEDSVDALRDIFTKWKIGVAVLLSVTSIAFYNAFGMAVTKYASATSRAVLDAARTLFVWIFTLCVLWERFGWPKTFIELIGFAFLVFGTVIYNEILIIRRYGLDKYIKANLNKDGTLKINDTEITQTDSASDIALLASVG